ncbi:MAG: hypothetical protein P9X24_08550 [Candidatus Hatepunaea meridiana]|nr:hypothetical protein [Candidatus Hatepunaea meridiana]
MIRRNKNVDCSKKEDAHRLIDKLLPDATWDDLMYEIYVREALHYNIVTEGSESFDGQGIEGVTEM